jgi:hypothetical protein
MMERRRIGESMLKWEKAWGNHKEKHGELD